MKHPLVTYRMILFLSAICTFLSTHSAIGGTAGILEGTVREKQNGEPLPGVNVVVVGLGRGTVTDASGHFEIQNLQAGSYDVRFTLVGFRSHLVKHVAINADLRTRLAVDMETSDVLLEEVVVTQERPLIQADVTSSAYFVTSEEIKVLPVTYVTDILGLKAGTTLEGNIRGGRASEVSYFVDGLSVQDMMGGGLGLKLPTSSVVNLSMYTGGFEAEYGNSLSGVVNIVTKTGTNDHRIFLRADKDDLFGGTQVSKTRELEFSVLGPVIGDRLFYTAAVTGIWSDTRWWQDFQRFFGSPVEKEVNGFAKLEYLFTPTLRLATQLLYAGHDWHDYDFSWRLNLAGLPPEHRTSYRLAAILSHSVSPSFFYNLSLSRYSVNARIADGTKEGVLASEPYQYDFFLRYIIGGERSWWVRSTQLTTTAKIDGTAKAGTEHLLKFGAEMNFYDLSSDIVKLEPRKTYFGKPLLGEPQLDFSSAYSYAPRSGAVYFQDKFDVMKDGGALLNFGARYDFLDPRARRPSVEPLLLADSTYAFRTTGSVPAGIKSRFSPRFGLGLQVQERGYLFFNLGFYFQNPLFDYLYSGLDRVALAKGIGALTGNPDLEPEMSTQWEVSYRHSLPMDVVASLAYFQKETSNLVDTKTFIPGDSKNAGNYGFAEFVNVPEARAWGWELVVTRDRGKWITGELSYTYMTTEGSAGSAYDGFYTAQFGLPPGQRVFPLSWDQRHTFKATLTIKPDEFFDLNGIIHWHSGRPYTNYPTATGFEKVDGGRFFQNNDRMPDYFNIDLKVQMHFRPDWWPEALMSLYVDVRNLTDAANVSWIDSNGRIGGELGDPSGYMIGRRARFGIQFSF